MSDIVDLHEAEPPFHDSVDMRPKGMNVRKSLTLLSYFFFFFFFDLGKPAFILA